MKKLFDENDNWTDEGHFFFGESLRALKGIILQAEAKNVSSIHLNYIMKCAADDLCLGYNLDCNEKRKSKDNT